MIVKIDWISFTVPVEVYDANDEVAAFYAFADAITELHPDLADWLDLRVQWEARNGRAPYRTAWKHPLEGITVFTHPALPHALVEISGRGCDDLADAEHTDEVLAAVAGRVTRLDIACDMLTDTRPLDFAEKRDVARFKAVSHVLSESGETYYVGARTSDRYARVYRYNPPHERAPFLRCEYSIKKNNARLMIPSIIEDGLMSVAASLGEAFGWTHEDWDTSDATPAELQTYRPDRREGKTLFWLADTVAPLLARLHNERVIDVNDWLTTQVIPRIINTEPD